MFNACIDSEATYSLLLKTAFDQVKEQCGELEMTEDHRCGASGTLLCLLGRSLIPFWICNFRYDYLVLVGDVKEVDLLLGMDFICEFHGKFDLSNMTMKLGLQLVVGLHTTKTRTYSQGR